MNTILKRIGIMVFVLLFGIFSMAASAFAAEEIDMSRDASVNVYFGADGTGFPNVEFSIYRVADISDSGEYTLAGDFAHYPVLVEDLDSSGWRALAQTLDTYVSRDQIEPLQTKKTGQDGRLCFEDLSAGIYLVTGSQYMNSNGIYTPEEPVSLKVQKVWNDDGCEEKRPEKITVSAD